MTHAIQGILVISLDFELMWGVLDSMTTKSYGPNILGARDVIPEILEVFGEREIHATWAVVGALFAQSRDDFISMLPAKRPKYADPGLSNYKRYKLMGETPPDEAYFFANSIIHRIAQTPNQEIGSHTFSHYYCGEAGQTVEDFAHDLEQARRIAEQNGIHLRSLVLPRNQFNSEYQEVIMNNGFTCYRGNETSWMYRSGNSTRENPLKRVLRLMDAYINISGHNCYGMSETKAGGCLCNIRSSRFLRPFSPGLSFLEPLKLRRIRSQMLHAARFGQVFHLWWHPHNFGTNTKENLDNLRSILDYYADLRQRHGFRSLNMSEVCDAVRP